MNKRTFGKTLNAITDKPRGQEPRLSVAKYLALDAETRAGFALYVLRNRGPLCAEMAADIERVHGPSMLPRSGYLYTYQDAGYTFICLAEHWQAWRTRQARKAAAGG